MRNSKKGNKKRVSKGVWFALALIGLGVLFVAFAGGVAAAQDTAENTTTPEETEVGTTSIGEGLSEKFESGSSTDVILRMGKVEAETPAGLTRTDARASAVSQMKRSAENSQRAAIDSLSRIDGAEVKNSLWMGNAIQLDVDTSRVTLDELRSLPGVARIHRNYRVEGLSVSSLPDVDADATQLESMSHTTGPYSWALKQVNVPDIQREFGSLLSDDDTRVAVLDTGIDPDHPDLTVDGWAEFDDNGSKVGSSPNDCGIYHGSHVSGTVAGNGSIDKDSYGLYGVAPDTVELYHGGVLTEESTGGCFTGSFASIVGGMQWAVENDADIISMSLGANGTFDEYIQPVRQAHNASSVVIAAAGNEREGTSRSPGNVYDSISVGASTRGEYIANFSSGEVIDTDNAWNDPPSDWPDSYTVPSVSAPGWGVYSSVKNGSYEGFRGTSMATPHVSGASALIMSVDPNNDMTPDELEGLLRNTSRKPDDTELDAEFSVGIDGTNSPVNEGDILQVDYSLTVSNEAETGLVGLGIFDQNGNTVERSADRAFRTIEPGDTATGTLRWDTTGQADGTYTAVVAAFNATADIAAGEFDDSASEPFGIDGTGGTTTSTNITTANGFGSGLASSASTSTTQNEPDTRYGTGIIDPYSAIVKEFVDGNVSETNVQEGTYEAGEVVNATATLNNTGDIQNEFFVQHEVRGPDGVWRDSGGTDGSSVTLSSGENQTAIDAAWEVADGVPGGEYDSRTTAWVEQDYEHRQNTADSVLLESAFTVSNNATEVSCGDVINESGLYELRNDVSGSDPCIEITASNVTFDGNGYSVGGSGSGWGIYVNGPVTDVTVKNVETRNWGRGIWLEDASKVDVLNISSESNSDAVRLSSSDNNSISSSDISNSGAGIRLVKSSSGNRITNNTIRNHTDGVNIRSSSQNTVKDNIISNNSGVGVRFWYSSEEGEVAGNTLDSNGIGILFEEPPNGQTVDNRVIDNRVFNSSFGTGIVLIDSYNSTVQNNTAESNERAGIFLRKSFNNTIEENTANSNGETGIAMNFSEKSIIQDNTAKSNGIGGVSLLNSSSENTIRNNTAKFNGQSGIGAGDQPFTKNNRNVIENNTANSNDWIGIGWVGSNNTIENNTAHNNTVYGIGLGALPSNNNELISNDIQFNDIGIGLNASSQDNVGIENIIENNTEAIITEEGAEILNQSGGDSGTSTTTTTVSTLGTGVGTLNQEEKKNAIRNNSAKNSDVAFRTSNGAATAIGNLDIGESSKPDTRVLLEGENVSVRSVTNPPDNPNAMSIGRYLNATEETNDSFLDLGIRYTEDDLRGGVNESSLSIWKHNGTEWRKINSTVNTTENVVNTSVTEFSTFGVFAEEQQNAFFDVNITGTNQTVTEGERLEVTANVTNTGDVSDTQNVVLNDTGFEDKERDNVSLTLDAGESNSSVVLSWDTEVGINGTGNVTVSTEDNSDQQEVTVQEQPEPAFFAVSDLLAPNTVVEGDEFSVNATVENTGDETQTQEVEFRLNGSGDPLDSVASLENDTVTLNGSENTTVEFGGISVSDAGEYDLGIFSNDDNETASLTVEEAPQALFDVNITETNSPVTEAETLEVTTNITNTGDKSGSQTIELDAGGLGNNSTTVALSGGNSTTETLSVGTGPGDAGEYTASVSSDNDTDSANVTVNEPASFDVTITNIDDSVTEGETITVAYEVNNTGDVTDTQDISFAVNGTTEDTETGVTLNGSETFSGQFTYTTNSTDVPKVTTTVASENDSDSATVAVSEQAFFDVTIDTAPSSVVSGDTISVNYTVENTGDAQDTQDITFDVNGTQKDTNAGVTLNGSETLTDSFTYTTDNGDLPAVSVTVSSDNDTATETVTVNETSLLAVNITGTNSPVTEGDILSIDINVTNTGDVSDTQNVTLSAGALGTNSTSVSLGGGKSTTERLSLGTGAGDAGEYTASVSSEDDTDNTSVTVQEPANFSVNITTTNSPVVEGETLDVTANVTNIGDETATQTIILDVGVLGTNSTQLSLTGGEAKTETFSVGTGPGDAGEYVASVSSENDTDSTNVTVTQPEANITVGLNPIADLDEETAVWANGTVSENDGVETDNMTVEATVTNESTGSTVAQKTIAVGDTDDVGNELTELNGNQTHVAFDFGKLDPGTVNNGHDYTATLSANAENTGEATDEDGFNVTAVSDGAFFAVEIVGDNGSITEGEVLEVTADVTNTGDQSGTQYITLNDTGFMDKERDNVSLTLDAGSNGSVTLTWETEVGINGTGNVTVSTDDDNDTREVTIEQETVLSPVNGFENPPHDLNGDGLYRDVNGDGSFNLGDVIALYDNYEDDSVLNNNPELFNFNRQENPDDVTLGDVIALYEEQ